MDLLHVTLKKLCNSDVCVLGMEIASFLRDKQRLFSCITEVSINTSSRITKKPLSLRASRYETNTTGIYIYRQKEEIHN